MKTISATQEMRTASEASEANRYVLSDRDFSYFKRAYGISKNNLSRLISQLEKLDKLVSERRLNRLRWEPIGEGVSHITQTAEEVRLDYRMLMRIVPELEVFNESLRERTFAMLMKKYRRIFGFTAREIAVKAQISLGFINSVEFGLYFPTPEKAEKIVIALGLTGKAKEMYWQLYRKERGCRSLTSRFEPSKKDGAGSILRQIRISAGWSQFELVKARVISGTYLCRIERGDMIPSAKTVNKLLKFYAVTKEESTALLEIVKVEKAARLKNKKRVRPLYENIGERMQVCICKDSAGKMLRSFREREYFPQRFLADQLGLHYSLISRWESDNRTISLIYFDSIVKTLNLSKQEKEELLEKIQNKASKTM